MKPNSNANYQNPHNMGAITEELDLGYKKKSLKGKAVKITKLVKKEDGNMTLKEETVLDGSRDLSQDDIDLMRESTADFNLNAELVCELLESSHLTFKQ